MVVCTISHNRSYSRLSNHHRPSILTLRRRAGRLETATPHLRSTRAGPGLDANRTQTRHYCIGQKVPHQHVNRQHRAAAVPLKQLHGRPAALTNTSLSPLNNQRRSAVANTSADQAHTDQLASLVQCRNHQLSKLRRQQQQQQLRQTLRNRICLPLLLPWTADYHPHRPV